MRRTVDDLIQIGVALNRQKVALPHGMFLPWISAEFGMSERTAQRLMKIGKMFVGKSANLADLSMHALDELSAADGDVHAEVERLLAAGHYVTAETVKAFKDDKKRADEAVSRAEALEERNRDLVANAHRKATQEAEQRFRSLLNDAEERVRVVERMAQASV